MVQLLLSVVQQGLRVAKVAAERSVNGGLERKAIGVDPSVVLIASAQQLVIVR
jgi:hypothetical protein